MVYVFVLEALFYRECYTTVRANLMYYTRSSCAFFTREELSVGVVFADVGLLKNYMFFFR